MNSSMPTPNRIAWCAFLTVAVLGGTVLLLHGASAWWIPPMVGALGMTIIKVL